MAAPPIGPRAAGRRSEDAPLPKVARKLARGARNGEDGHGPEAHVHEATQGAAARDTRPIAHAGSGEVRGDAAHVRGSAATRPATQPEGAETAPANANAAPPKKKKKKATWVPIETHLRRITSCVCLRGSM